MKFAKEKEILPEFPRTVHLPHKPNTDAIDRVASEAEAAVVFAEWVNVEEKIDGSSCGMTLRDGHPLIRNRDHILRKGYSKPGSAAKEQFLSVWNWFYDNRAKFEAVAGHGPYSVYGEWCVARHGIAYDRLPAWFVAYDLYDQEKRLWVKPDTARLILADAGFALPRLWFCGHPFTGGYGQLEAWANARSEFAGAKAEGVYVKAFDDRGVTHRFKMVREDFVRGAYWNPKAVTKNSLGGPHEPPDVGPATRSLDDRPGDDPRAEEVVP